MSRTIGRSLTLFALTLALMLGFAAAAQAESSYSYNGTEVGTADLTATAEITYNPVNDGTITYKATFTPSKDLYDKYQTLQRQLNNEQTQQAWENVGLSTDLTSYVDVDNSVITATIQFDEGVTPNTDDNWWAFDGLGILVVDQSKTLYHPENNTVVVTLKLADDWANHIDSAMLDKTTMKTATFEGSATVSKASFKAGATLVTSGDIKGTFVNTLKRSLLDADSTQNLYNAFLAQVNQQLGTNISDIPATKTVPREGTKHAQRTTSMVARDISDASASLAADTYAYTGSAIEPAATVGLTVERQGIDLNQGADYTVSYSDNTNVGTATATIAGAGNYTGTITKGFTIEAAGIADASVSFAKAAYTGKALTPAATVKVNGKTLTAGTDYSIAYSNNTNAGTAKATLTGTGNYTGTKAATFTIAKAANPVTVKAKTAKVKYSKVKKKAQTLKVSKVLTVSKAQGTVTYAKASGNKKIAVNAKTGKVTVKKGLKKGTYKVKVKVTAAGNANYAAKTVTTTFKVKVK